MAHELLIENGSASMFYVDGPPWHGLGTRLDEPPTSPEAIEAAGLDWTVAKVPLHGVGGTGSHELPDRFALLREDWIPDPDSLFWESLAGRGHPSAEPSGLRLLRPARAGRARLVCHRGRAGKRRASLDSSPTPRRFRGRIRRPLRRFLLLSNSHDGTSSVQIQLTPTRVVCNNTLIVALSDGRANNIRHGLDMAGRLEQAKALLGLVNRRYDEVAELFRRMAATELTRERALRYFEHVFPNDTAPGLTPRARLSPLGAPFLRTRPRN